MSTAACTPTLLALLLHGRRPWEAYAEDVEALGATAVAERELGLLAPQLIAEAERRIGHWRTRGFHPVSVLDPDYPENLRAVHDRPPVIFTAGSLIPRDAKAVALIGSRRATAEGLAGAMGIASALVDRGFTVLSGLAQGIDAAAHQAALARGGRTVAVIATGLCHCYPPEHFALQRRIAAKGALVTRCWPEAKASRQSFAQRNALMSGLALANVVVEASRASGTRTQVRAALGQGRPVLLMQRVLDQEWARELACRGGVHVVRGAGEVVETVERLASTGPLAW